MKYTIIRQPSTTFVRFPDNSYANYFQLKVYNQTANTRMVDITPKEQGVSIICGECKLDLDGFSDRKALLVITVPFDYKKNTVTLILKDGGEVSIPIIKPN